MGTSEVQWRRLGNESQCNFFTQCFPFIPSFMLSITEQGKVCFQPWNWAEHAALKTTTEKEVNLAYKKCMGKNVEWNRKTSFSNLIITRKSCSLSKQSLFTFWTAKFRSVVLRWFCVKTRSNPWYQNCLLYKNYRLFN